MTVNPYAVPLEDLERTARIAAASQGELQDEPQLVEGPYAGTIASGGGGGCDADGD